MKRTEVQHSSAFDKILFKGSRFLREYILLLLIIAGILSNINYTIISGRIPLKLSIGDVAIVFLVFLYIFMARIKIYSIIRANNVYFILGLLFIVLSLVTSTICNDLWLVSIKFCIKICLLFFILIYIYHISCLTKKSLDALYLIVIILNILGVVEFFAPEIFNRIFYLFIDQKHAVTLEYSRVGSLLINPNIFGVFNALIIIIMINLRYGGRFCTNGYLYGSTLLCSALGVILSGSMNAVLTLFLGTIIILYVIAEENRGSFQKILLWCVILLLMIFGAIKYNGTFALSVSRDFPIAFKIYDKQPISLRDLIPTYSSHERGIIWEEGLRLLREHPIFGIGANQFAFRNKFMPNYSMHNIFGEIMVNHGIAGLSIFIMLIGIWFLHTKYLWQVGLVVTILISHMLDCFVTHSIVWVIFVPWLIVITTKNTNEMFEPAQSMPVIGNS